jgi:hypothetical protein
MMRLDAVREMIIKARCSEAAARPFPSGVAAGDNRSDFLNASEAGRCTRWLWYDKHGVAGVTHHPTASSTAATPSSIGAPPISPPVCTRRRTPPLRRRQAEAADAARLSPRRPPDGLIEWHDRSETVLEVKSHGTAQNYDNGPSEMHVHQAELNIELFHEATAHRPEDAIIVYGLAEDYGRLALHRVERRPAIFVEMLGKAAAAFDANSAAAVTAEGVVTRQCVICPYRSRCAAAQAHAIPAAGTGGLDEATLRSIDRLIAARQRAVEAEGEAVRARAEVEAEIIATLTDAGASRIKRNGYAVQLKTPADGLAVLEIRSA